MGSNGGSSEQDHFGVDGLDDRLSVFFRTSEPTSKITTECQMKNVGGMTVIQAQLSSAQPGTVCIATLPHSIDVGPVIVAKLDSPRLTSWIWFFRDYFGFKPRIVSIDESIRTKPTVTLSEPTPPKDFSGPVFLREKDGGSEIHDFTVVQNHPALFPLQKG